MSSTLRPINVRTTEKTSKYEDAGQLISRIGDRHFSGEFRKVRNMGKNSKVWFTVTVRGSKYLGQAISTHSGWKVTVFDSRIGASSMVALVSFHAKDRYELEEKMYSLYFELFEFSDDKNENTLQ